MMCEYNRRLRKTYEGLNTDGIRNQWEIQHFALEAWAEQEKNSDPLLTRPTIHSVARAYGVAYDSFLPEANLT